MNQNPKPTSLKGKRKKPVPKNANPLFIQWLTEWRDEASEKGWKSHHTFAKALKTLKLFPLTLETGKDCRMLQNFGDKICKMLDEKLTEYRQNNGSVPSPQEKEAVVIPPNEPTSSMTHVISDNSDSEPEKCSSPKKKRKQSSKRKSREYVPGYKSGPYAIILTLYRYMQNPDFKGFMTKNELSHAAQPLSEKSFSRPDPGSHYTAWSSISSLIKRGLVNKEGCPAKYALTDAGYDLGSRLENVENGKLPEQLQDSPASQLSTNHNSDTSASKISHQNNFESAERSVSPPSHIVLSDSEEDSDIDNIHSELKRPDPEVIPSEHIGFCDDPLYILSDEDDNVNAVQEIPGVPERHYRLHSLSPSLSSSSLSPPHPTNNVSHNPVNSAENVTSRKQTSPEPSVRENIPKGTNDVEILEVENFDFDNDNDNFPATNLILESSISKFSWEVRENNNIQKTDENDDDDELPDLDEFIPLSKRLMKKGLVSSTLLNTHVSKVDKGGPSIEHMSNDESKADISAEGSEDQPIDLDCDTVSLSGKYSYTSIQEKNTISQSCLSSSTTASNVSNGKTPVTSQHIFFNSSVPSISSASSVSCAQSISSVSSISCAQSISSVSSVTCAQSISSASSVSCAQSISSASSVSCAQSISSASSLPSTSDVISSKPVPKFTLLPDTFDIVLCVDQREFYGSKSNSKTLLPDLIKSGINCDLRHLNISDLLWVARERSNPIGSESSNRRELVLNFAIERKRTDDLVSSISSGRLKEQKFRLKHSGISELIILIEEYGSIQNFSISEDRIKQSIVNSQIIDGFKVKRCGSSKEAVAYLSLMTRFLQSHFHSKTLHAVSHEWLKEHKKSAVSDREQYLMPFDIFNEASIKQKTLSVREMFGKQLLQIPGISLERASAITKVYPTLSSLIEAYKMCPTEKAKESLLAYIKCGNKDRNLGIAVSRTVNMLYNAAGPLT